MADWDDERPDFDAAFRDEPEDDPRAARRGARRRRARKEPEPDSASTGEVPRPRASSGRSGRSGSSRARSRTPRARRGGGGVSGGAAVLQNPRARLLIGIAFAAILIVVIALVVKDCQRSQLEDSYNAYINDVAEIVTTSAEQGATLRQVMGNPRGDNPPQLKAKIAAIANDAQDTLTRAEALDPPGALSAPQRNLILALQYRQTGLSTLAQNLPTLLQSKDAQTKASGIAGIMKLFQASDVIYDTSFRGPATDALESDDITGLEVPQLQPFLPNAALTTVEGAKGLLPDLQRRTQASGDAGGGGGSGNLRGTSIESTVALPSETTLTPGTTVAVQQTEQLKWQVTVMNGGDFDETNVVVHASFFYPSSPQDTDDREVAIPSIASGESVNVEIEGPGSDKVVFGEQGTLKIEVEPVTGETRVDNNTVEYPVKITI